MAAPATISVFDNLYDSAGNAVANVTVQCILNGTQETTSGGLIAAKQQSTTTDANGLFMFTVVANDLLSPANSTYTIITPFRTYDIAPQSANGNSQQTTAANVIVNTPTPLAPAVSNVTGPLTVTGALTVTGLITGQAGETISGGTFSIPAGGFTMAGPLTLTAAASQIIPGATSMSIRDTGNANDNLLVSNAGLVTVRAGLTVTAGGLTITAGNITASAGNSNLTLGTGTITSGAINSQTISAAANLTGTLTVASTLTVTAGGLTVTAGNLTVTAGNLTFAAAASQVVPGATSLALRNNANNANNLLLTDAGLATLRNALSVPPSASGTVPTTAYGSVPVKIDDQLLAAAVATVTFVNPLPTGFRHLLIQWYARGDTAATTINALITFNNDTGANYDIQVVQGSAAVAAAGEGLGSTNIILGVVPAASATANYFGMGDARINHYTSTVGNKLIVANSFYATANTTGTGTVRSDAGKWRTTGTAITRLDIKTSAGNFIIGSLFTLYGIP